MSITLHRVGVPSIGETYISRWSWIRGTGGIGTGVYAFRSRQAAERNIAEARHDKDLFVLEEALTRPLQPEDIDATEALNQFWRMMDRLSSHSGFELDELRDDPLQSRRVSLVGADEGDEVFQHGAFLDNVAFRLQLGIPQVRDRYGLDDEGRAEIIRDAVTAVEEAIGECKAASDTRTCVQPINKWLWPEFDGVCPPPEAGGDTGKFGCVVFKEKVDACVERETELFDDIPAETLNACFARRGIDALRAEIRERMIR